MISFPHTEAALKQYDEGDEPACEAMFATAMTIGELEKWNNTWNAAYRHVQLAFFEDTKEFNSLSACMVTDLNHLRQLVKKYPSK